MRRTCNVTGIRANEKHFYADQKYLRLVDSFRRTRDIPMASIRSMFNSLNTLK
jgi:hypothetical protein